MSVGQSMEHHLGDIEGSWRPLDVKIPTIALSPIDENLPVPEDVLSEVQRAIAVTLEEFGVDLSKYQQGFTTNDLVDTSPDEKGFRRYPRLPGADKDAVVAVVSTSPVLDSKGREVIALKTPDNLLYLNLRKLDDAFVEGAETTPQAIKAGIVIVEEAIHYVQHTLMGEKISDTTDTQGDADKHMQHGIEVGAAPFKKRVYQRLYPSLDIRVKGVDF